MLLRSCHTVLFALLIAGSISPSRTAGAEDPTPMEVFNQRILPIFRSPDPSSCVQCHLASVDLKNYILPSHEKTFLSLRDQGLIDLQQPERSKILQLIRMGDQDLDEGARLIHAPTRNAELAAFQAWLEACCADKALTEMPALSPREYARPANPDPVIRHHRKSRVLDSFIRNVWSQRMRCFPCHTPDEIDPENPRHQAAVKTQRELRERYGDAFERRMNLFAGSPLESMQRWIIRSQHPQDNELPLINLSQPTQSLVILKPTAKLPRKRADGTFEPPSSTLPVSHMGGLKMHPHDQSYKSFLAWIQDYANVVQQVYSDPSELPADNWYPTGRVLRLTETPDTWGTGTPVQLFVHAYQSETGEFADEPLAFTQGTVTPRHIVNGALFLLVKKRDGQWNVPDETQPLPRGDYLIKVYVDRDGRVAANPAAMLNDAEHLAGQVILRRARWREGFPRAEQVSASQLQTP